MKSPIQIVLPPPDDPSLSERAISKFQRTFLPPKVRKPWPDMPYPTVDLVFWQQPTYVNFGDELSRTIVELMLARKGRTVYDHAVSKRRLLAIGSILHDAQEGTTVWGTGLHGAVAAEYHFYNRLDVRAVRGPVTQQFLYSKGVAVPEIFGDPALLLPELTGDRFRKSKVHNIGYVMHLNDIKHLGVAGIEKEFPGVHLIDPLRSWDVVVADITSCERIVSSSLHGIIVAEAFGIPAVYVRLSDREPILKFHDYYGGTGRELTFVTTFRGAMDHDYPAPPTFDTTELRDSFPYDIWDD